MSQDIFNPLENIQSHDWNKERLEQLKNLMPDLFTKNEILFATDGDKETLVCLDGDLAEETVEHFKKNTEQKLIVLERALDTTKKWNLKHYMKDNFKAF